MIAVEIAEKLKFDTGEMVGIFVCSAFHDAAEAVLGDIPTPTKRRLKERAPGTIEAMEQEIMGTEFDPMSSFSNKIKEVVKFADRIEAIWFLSENGYGRHAEIVMKRLKGDFFKAMAETDPTIKDAVYCAYTRIMEGEIVL